jgi:hypothetical protein
MSLAGPKNYLTFWMFQKEEARHRGSARLLDPTARQARRGYAALFYKTCINPIGSGPFEGLF